MARSAFEPATANPEANSRAEAVTVHPGEATGSAEETPRAACRGMEARQEAREEAPSPALGRVGGQVRERAPELAPGRALGQVSEPVWALPSALQASEVVSWEGGAAGVAFPRVEVASP